jgi:3-hydroxybutyryl-CoA dehydrogenase
MKIMVVGSAAQSGLLQQKLAQDHEFTHRQYSPSDPAGFDLVFDFYNEGGPEALDNYAGIKGLVVFLSNAHFSLTELAYFQEQVECRLYGFNGEPTFFERELWEVTVLGEKERDALPELMQSLAIKYELIDDRVGMVSPRVVAMIINEAYFTVMEGTASRADIDLGMKLGTNYPLGPFEWVHAWGVDRVYELLEALYEDTKDERYKICPLLKKEYLNLSPA